MADAERRSHRIDLIATILLAVAAVATAWSTYQSTQWRGELTLHGARSTAARIESSTASTRAGQLTQVDIATFTQWVNATEAGNASLADFYRQRFRKEFKPAFNAWLATGPLTNPNAPGTPFVMPDYQVAENTEATRLNDVAQVESTRASDSLERADNFMLAVVLFAVSLFFAGISTKIRAVGQREAVLALGVLLFVGTFVWIATLPQKFFG